MTVSQKVLGQLLPTANTLTDCYTVPALTQATISSLTVSSNNVSSDIFNISVAIAGAADTPAQYIYSGVIISGNDTFAATLGITLSAGDVVRVFSLNGYCAFNLFGVETL